MMSMGRGSTITPRQGEGHTEHEAPVDRPILLCMISDTMVPIAVT